MHIYFLHFKLLISNGTVSVPYYDSDDFYLFIRKNDILISLGVYKHLSPRLLSMRHGKNAASGTLKRDSETIKH